MVFILYKLYVLLPYTYPTSKLSPHKRLCALLDFQIYNFTNLQFSVFFKPFGLRGHRQCPHKTTSCCNTHVIIQIFIFINHIYQFTHTHTHTYTHTHTHVLNECDLHFIHTRSVNFVCPALASHLPANLLSIAQINWLLLWMESDDRLRSR